MEIKTLAQILAETSKTSTTSGNNKTLKKTAAHKQREANHPSPSKTVHTATATTSTSASTSAQSRLKTKQKSVTHSLTFDWDNNNNKRTNNNKRSNNKSAYKKNTANTQGKRKQRQQTFHPAANYQAKIQPTEAVKEIHPNSIRNILAQVKSNHNAQPKTTAAEYQEQQHPQTVADHTSSSSVATADSTKIANSQGDNPPIDNLPDALKVYLKTPEQRQAEKEEIKANSRLRWLAFYYLSRREHSAEELRQKLLNKDQDPDKVDKLLTEFAEKGYQSDYRTAIMLIREGIRKGRGRVRIKNDFYQRKVDMPTNIDELIDMAIADNEEFTDVLSNNDLVEGVDWLRLAVEARVKKYGAAIPSETKDKARQLRFLQYRGFQPDICFQAIHYNLENLDDRF